MPRARAATDEQILEAYTRLQSTPKVMRELLVGQATVSRVLRRCGVAVVGNRPNVWAPGTYPGKYTGSTEEILEMYKSGMSYRQIAEKIDRSVRVVGARIKAAGIARPYQARGAQHSMWAGGRLDDGQGYFKVWVGDNDPMAKMRDASGYVKEHRLVMARKLGRPLRGDETVHHIDGDRTNNSYDNLQLRHGSHGKNIAMVCGDCGSHNVAPTKLKDVL